MSRSAKSIWPAPAKLNLFLHIIGRRDDGNHDLQTLFQILEWGDELEIETTAKGGVSRTHLIDGIPEHEDLSIRAGRLLKNETGCSNGASITLKKNIPLGSGLGGGSSDAATVLHALNRLWGCGLSREDLLNLGLKLGADVPLFVQGHSAWAEGVGEKLREFKAGDSWYVLVFPGIVVSTAKVFEDPGLKRDSKLIQVAEYSFSSTGNDCEAVVMRLFPVLQEIMQQLSAYGTPRLTGTGSCIFLPVNGKNEANRITMLLKSRYNVRAVRGVDHSPLIAKLSAFG